MLILSAIIVILLLRPWWRPIAAYSLLALALLALYRLAPLIGVAQGWLNSVAGGALIGFAVGMLLIFVPAYNLLVEARRHAGHERVDKEHDALRR